MSNTSGAPRLAAAVKFKWQKDDKTYDYWVPEGLELAPGDKVIVETRRGETEVEIVQIKDGSEMASASIIRRADPKPQAETVSEDWDF